MDVRLKGLSQHIKDEHQREEAVVARSSDHMRLRKDGDFIEGSGISVKYHLTV